MSITNRCRHGVIFLNPCESCGGRAGRDVFATDDELEAQNAKLKAENGQHCIDYQQIAQALGILEELPEQKRVLERVAELRAALEPFAELVDKTDPVTGEFVMMRVDDCERAAAVLGRKGER